MTAFQPNIQAMGTAQFDSDSSSGFQSPRIHGSPPPGPAYPSRPSSPTPSSSSCSVYSQSTVNSLEISASSSGTSHTAPVTTSNTSVVTVQPMAPALPGLLPLTLTHQQMTQQYINLTNSLLQTAVPPQAAYINGVACIPQLLPIQSSFPVLPNCVPTISTMPTMSTMPPCVGPCSPNTGLAPAQHFAPQPTASAPQTKPIWSAPAFTGPFSVSPRRFSPKNDSNRAKGNFFISKENIQRMMALCHEPFLDEKVAFAYYKESVAMQINDGEIGSILVNAQGVEIILINIHLHFKAKPHNVMYLIAGRNNPQFKGKVDWAVYEFVSAADLHQRGITSTHLPRSSREKSWFRNGTRHKPTPDDLSDALIARTNFKNMSAKRSMRNGCTVPNCAFKCKKFKPSKGFGQMQEICAKCGHGKEHHGTVLPEMPISQKQLRRCVAESRTQWDVIPVVVINKKKQWIEWKKFVQVRAGGQIGCVGISLRYSDTARAWRIECMEYDAGRIYNQYRLVGCAKRGDYEWIDQHVTTSLDIYDERYQQSRRYRGRQQAQRHCCHYQNHY